MIKAGPIVASLAATFSATLAAAASPYVFAVIAPSAPTKEGSESLNNASGSDSKRNAEDKFVPRYDGLRFIETLVTAHRHSVDPTTNVSVGVIALEHETAINNNTTAPKTIQMGLRGVPMIRTQKRKMLSDVIWMWNGGNSASQFIYQLH